MWANFLALGTVGFWVFGVLVFILLIAAVEYEKPGLATLSLVVAGLVLWLFGNVNVFALAAADPLLALGLTAGYFAVGALWSLAKWWFYVRRQRERYDELKTAFLKQHGCPEKGPVPDRLKAIWKARRPHYNSYEKPQARENKGRILTWMIYWPWSCVWTILNDPVKRLWKSIFNAMKAIFQKVADSAYKDVEDDFTPPKNPLPETAADLAVGEDEDDMRYGGKSAK